jgi:drug/metabolite transporter (DMT)-like permease
VKRTSLAAGIVLALAILAVSWGAILVRFCGSAPLVVAFYRLALATALLVPLALVPAVAAPALPSAASARLVFLAGLFLALHFGAWISSLSYTTVASSVVLVASQPLFSALFSGRILGEEAPARLYLGAVLALAGTAIIMGGDSVRSGGHLKGDLLALAGAAAGSGYFILGRRLRREMPFFRYLLFVDGTAALLLGLAALASGESLAVPRGDLPWLFLMAAGPTLVGHGSFIWAVRRMKVFYANLAAFGEPILASVYAFFLLGEPLRPTWCVGGALVLGGIFLALPGRARAPLESPAGPEASPPGGRRA